MNQTEEDDVVVAARIGQQLLEQTRVLEERVGELEDELAGEREVTRRAEAGARRAADACSEAEARVEQLLREAEARDAELARAHARDGGVVMRHTNGQHN